MRDFKKLIVWQKSMELFIDIHKFSKKLPPEEKFEMGSQIRRAAFSIPSNIAEGSSKATEVHKKSFLTISLGSAFEVENGLIAIGILYIQLKNEADGYITRAIEIQKMIQGLINKLG